MTYPSPHDRDPFSRKNQIERLRASQHHDNDWFFDKFEQTVNTGAKGFFKLGLIALIVNLLFWGTLIVLGAWALGHFVL